MRSTTVTAAAREALFGSTTPRIFTPPLVRGPAGPCSCGCALSPRTSLGFSVVDFYRDVLKIEPLPWQRWVLIHALELRPSGRFRFRTILILVARQNGKTSLVEVKNLWKMFVLRVMLIIGTAQDLETAEESWDKGVEIVESIPELAAEIAHVDKTNGKKALKLVGGPRWKIKAATRRARGLSGDDVNLDELREHQTWLAWGAVTKTTMARPNAQIWAFSNAGDDKSIVLNALQALGRAAAKNPRTADPSLGHFEWSAPDDVRCTCGRPDEVHTPDCRLRDPAARAQANPALGYTITEEALDSALGTDPEEIYRTECLCQRVTDMTPRWSVISQAVWEALADTSITPADRVGRPAFCAESTPDRSMSAIVVAFRRPDGDVQWEVVDHRPGTGWVAPRMVELIGRYDPCAVVVDKGGPAASVVDDLEAEDVEVVQPSAAEVTEAYGQVYQAIMETTGTHHCDQEELNTAVAGAGTRKVGDRLAWDRYAGSDSCPLVAATGADWGLRKFGNEGDALDNIW